MINRWTLPNVPQFQSHPLARAIRGQTQLLQPLGTDEKDARNNKWELRQNPGGNTWCQIWACHCFEGTWMEERVNSCVFQTRCIYADYQMNLIFPGYSQLPRDRLFRIFTVMVTFTSKLLSRVILVLRMFLNIINIWNNKTSHRCLQVLAKLISYHGDTISTHSEFILQEGKNNLICLSCFYSIFVKRRRREAAKEKESHKIHVRPLSSLCPHGYPCQGVSTKAIAESNREGQNQ